MIFFDIPAYLKIGIIFLSLLAVCRLGISLELSLIVHSSLLTIWSGAGGLGLVTLVRSLADTDNVLLALVIVLMLFFTEVLNKTERMKLTVDALKSRISSPKILLAGLPALIGLLPMPGGALFSAPMVDSLDADKKISQPEKAAINYWFRHIWEYWWPLYPGAILAIMYSGLPAGAYFMLMIPFTFFSVIGGTLFILRRVKIDDRILIDSSAKQNGNWAAALGPISLLVFVTVVGSYILPPLFGITGKTANLSAMCFGLVLSSTVALKGNNSRNAVKCLKELASEKSVSLLLIVAGVQMFSASLRLPVGDETLVSMMRAEFTNMGMPVVVILMMVPFVSGIVTGIAMGFVGASFPLVFAMLDPNPSFNTVAAATALSYGFGYIGMILSPVHICFVVTNRYFNCGIFKVYPYLVAPVMVVLTAALLLAGLYYTFL